MLYSTSTSKLHWVVLLLYCNVALSHPFTENDVRIRLISQAALRKGRELLPVRALTVEESSLPESFDARKNWPQCDSIGDIWDQGACGDCWAVATVTAATDRMCIGGSNSNKHRKDTDISAFSSSNKSSYSSGSKQPRLSVEHMVGCCRACGFGCGNGFPNYAWMWLAGKEPPGSTPGVYGLVTGGQFGDRTWCSAYQVKPCNHYQTPGVPLPSCEGGIPAQTPKCPTKCDADSSYGVPFDQDIHRFESAYAVPSHESQIRAEILAHGPVTAGFTVYSDWVHYRKGVYKSPGGDELGAHAVRIIGWGTEEGDDYWLVANSFGDKWGDGGFFKILRGNDECGIESSIIAGLYKKQSTDEVLV